MDTVRHFPEQQKFSLLKNFEEAGFLTYRVTGDGWEIDETVVSPAFRGQGLARILVEAAIAEAGRQNVGLTARCEYAAGVLAGRRK